MTGGSPLRPGLRLDCRHDDDDRHHYRAPQQLRAASQPLYPSSPTPILPSSAHRSTRCGVFCPHAHVFGMLVGAHTPVPVQHDLIPYPVVSGVLFNRFDRPTSCFRGSARPSPPVTLSVKFFLTPHFSLLPATQQQSDCKISEMSETEDLRQSAYMLKNRGRASGPILLSLTVTYCAFLPSYCYLLSCHLLCFPSHPPSDAGEILYNLILRSSNTSRRAAASCRRTARSR